MMTNTGVLFLIFFFVDVSFSSQQIVKDFERLTEVDENVNNGLSNGGDSCEHCVQLRDPDSSQCPVFLIQSVLTSDRDKSFFRTVRSPSDACGIPKENTFANPSNFENFLRSSFKDFKSFPPVSVCFGEAEGSNLSRGEKNVILAEHYSNHYRLQEGLIKNLQDISAIDQILGRKEKPFLYDISCRSLEGFPKAKKECLALKSCKASGVVSKDGASGDSVLERKAHNTYIAVEGIKRIDAKIEELNNRKNTTRINDRERQKARKEIAEFQKRKENILKTYPWIAGRVFKNGVENVANAKQMGELIERQLLHTRRELKKNAEKVNLASQCLSKSRGGGRQCSRLDIPQVVANTPPLLPSDVFPVQELSYKQCEQFKGNYLKSSECRRKARGDHAKKQVSRKYLARVQCLKTQRDAVRQSNINARDFMLEAGLMVGTVGLGSMALLGKLGKGTLLTSKAGQKAGQATRINALGLIGLDVGFSVPYMKDAVKACEESINQLTGSGAGSSRCENLALRTRHTSDYQSCVLGLSLASLPLTLPLAAGIGRSIYTGGVKRAFNKLAGARSTRKGTNPAVIEEGATPRHILVQNSTRLKKSYSSLLSTHPEAEQDIIMEAILGMELKGMKKREILEKTRGAINKCKK